MSTWKEDFRRLCHFALWVAVAIGLLALLHALTGCAAMRGAGEGLKQDAKWLPEPYGTIADVAGTALVMFAGHKTARHVTKRRAARKAKLEASGGSPQA